MKTKKLALTLAALGGVAVLALSAARAEDTRPALASARPTPDLGPGARARGAEGSSAGPGGGAKERTLTGKAEAPALDPSATTERAETVALAQERTVFEGWFAAILIAGASIAAIAWAHNRAKGDVRIQPVRVLSSSSLGGRARLVLVEVRGRELLLSVGDGGAQLLTEWAAESEVEPETGLLRQEAALRAEPAAGTTPAASIAPTRLSGAITGLLQLRADASRAERTDASSTFDAEPTAGTPGRLGLSATELYGRWSKHLNER